eukprot:CAMPEP_0203932972 /NCGR_PEP_ID=MMETSP0359-20131031/71246_1 /ASSEMBLY_ACC=CAM_ASM_000338 /TAXON_ID=268821 /ORGANISM="Scrippsiella Hangoei, Strain SHTV-5" /LENGTH=30 /DNA_ID= /DNA_START= /DNA_END= /DNA_ORIENTATION=
MSSSMFQLLDGDTPWNGVPQSTSDWGRPLP